LRARLAFQDVLGGRPAQSPAISEPAGDATVGPALGQRQPSTGVQRAFNGKAPPKVGPVIPCSRQGPPCQGIAVALDQRPADRRRFAPTVGLSSGKPNAGREGRDLGPESLFWFL